MDNRLDGLERTWVATWIYNRVLLISLQKENFTESAMKDG